MFTNGEEAAIWIPYSAAFFDASARSAAWRSLGIQSERGRDGRLIGYSDTLALPRGRSSIFDPVLAELAYRWYSQPGDVILDPFAGEGSILRAAILKGCRPIGLEIDKDRFPRLVDQVKQTYKNMYGGKVQFT